jgi:hypothetical protein
MPQVSRARLHIVVGCNLGVAVEEEHDPTSCRMPYTKLRHELG